MAQSLLSTTTGRELSRGDSPQDPTKSQGRCKPMIVLKIQRNRGARIWTPIQTRARGALFLPLLAGILGLAASSWGLEEGPEGLAVHAPVPLAVEPEKAQIRLFLSEAEGKPGDLVPLKLTLLTNVLLRTIKIAINFDESFLRLERLERALDSPITPVDDVAKTQTDNTDPTPGDQLKEGWITLEVSAAETVGTLKWPIGQEIPLYVLQFRILEKARAGRTPVVFAKVGSDNINLAFGNEAEVQDALVPRNVEIQPADLLNGGVIILGLGEIGFFLRADTNLDNLRDISDPIRTLGYLFSGDAQLPCFDAADSNDDGEVDVSDPVHTLYWLYGGGTSPPEPSTWGPDPTRDTLCCEETGGCT